MKAGDRSRLSTRPSALIFDWDNTLVDTWGVIHDALNTTLVAFGKTPWTMDETRTRVRKSMRDSFPDLFGDEWEDAGEVFYRRYAEIHMLKLEAKNGAARMLESLHGQGFVMAVVSNKTGDYLRAEARHLGWDRFFSRIVGANDAVRDKPAPDPILMALEGTDIETGAGVWFVGDADIDLHCAHSAGCYPVLLRDQPPSEGEFPDHPPARHFSDCMALCKFVDNM
jgi:phosphoglycolate phosphatase